MATGISKLIEQHRNGRTNEQISEDCGGLPSAARIASFTNQNQTSFPALYTIQGLAEGLGVDAEQVVFAYGATIGLWDDDESGALLRWIGHSGLFTDAQREILAADVKEFVDENRGQA